MCVPVDQGNHLDLRDRLQEVVFDVVHHLKLVVEDLREWKRILHWDSVDGHHEVAWSPPFIDSLFCVVHSSQYSECRTRGVEFDILVGLCQLPTGNMQLPFSKLSLLSR